ncbi:MAG: transglutaminase domain-containing protein [Anaerolineae bacterium]|nr:transglutaminase domain-containing protein [Anaerolineae bacterium]
MNDAYREDRPRLDWFLFILLIAAVVCLPLTLQEIELLPEASRLIYPALWAAVLGVVMASTPAPGWLAWILGIVLGIEYATQFAGKLLPNLGMVADDLSQTVRWVWQLVAGHTVSAGYPFARSLGYVGGQVTTMLENLVTWFGAVQSGAPSTDNTALLLLASVGTWLLSWNAGFELFRRRRTFVAMLPLGTAIISCVAFTYIGMVYVQVFLGITLLALVRANVKRMESFWLRMKMDFSPELRRDATLAGGALSGLIVVVALLVPYLTFSPAVFAFWEWIEPKVTGFYDDLDRAFAGRNPVPTPTGVPGGLGAHNVAQSGVLGDDAVFIVRVSDPAPPPEEEIQIMMEVEGLDIQDYVPQRYWRERTYDVYTGHGWDNSGRASLEYQENQAWTELDYPGTVVTQTYTLLGARAPFGFAINEMQSAASDYEVIVHGDGDLAAYRIEGQEYTVVSRAPEPTVDQLMAAEGPYPPWVAERYLALPRVPDRVRDLAEQVVGEAQATTRYDKAKAIELYIRQFQYDAELEPPPLSTDIVEYFLFDAQRGYCDYSATAMVVMLRSVGVAARYASGYGMGAYDYPNAGWVVTEENAHAWAEVFFPGLGWVEFEPTPIQRVFDRGSSLSGLDLDALPTAEEEQASLPPLWVWGAGLAFVLLFVIIWPPRWFRRKRSPRDLVHRVYERVVRRARWVGVGPAAGQTPYEFLAGLTYEIEQRVDASASTSEDIRVIGAIYQRARYSNSAITARESDRAEASWRRLRGKLMWMIFAKRPQRQPSFSTR